MAIQIACPKCNSTYNVAEAALGKMVKCQNCQSPFAAKAMAGQKATPTNVKTATARAAGANPPTTLAQRPTGNRMATAGAKPIAGKPTAAQNQELTRLGVDGTLAPPPSLFATAQPPASGPDPLANHVVQGLNFVPIDQKKLAAAGAQEAAASNPFELRKKVEEKPKSGYEKKKDSGRRSAASVSHEDHELAEDYTYLVLSVWIGILGFVFIGIPLIVAQSFYMITPENFSAASLDGKIIVGALLVLFFLWSLANTFYGYMGFFAFWKILGRFHSEKIAKYLFLTFFVPFAGFYVFGKVEKSAREYLLAAGAKVSRGGAKF